MKISVFLVWNWGVVMSFMGPSAQGLEGETEVIMDGERLSRKPIIMNGIERNRVTLGLAILEEMTSEVQSYDGIQSLACLR